MPIKIENLTNRLVLLRCNSGETLHLPPRTTSPELPDVEVKNNSKVEKLIERQVIKIHEGEPKQPHAAALSGAKKEKERTETTKPKK